MTDLDERCDRIFAARDRDDMAPTIDAFGALLAEHPDSARVVYELGGAYDTGGEPARAIEHYERALQLGLYGELRRRCLLQFASTLRNLDRIEESLAMFDEGLAEFPGSPSLAVFKALALHSAGAVDEALALALTTIADHAGSAEIARYEVSIRGYAEELSAASPRPSPRTRRRGPA